MRGSGTRVTIRDSLGEIDACRPPSYPLPHPTAAAPSPAAPIGSSHLFVLGGDDGKYFFGTDGSKLPLTPVPLIARLPQALLARGALAVIAHVAPEPGAQLDAAELRRICAGALEDHKVPRRIDVHAELPRTANGKIDRRALAGAGATRPAD